MIDEKNLRFTGRFLRSLSACAISSSRSGLRPDPVYQQGYGMFPLSVALFALENVPSDKPVDVPLIGFLTYNSTVKRR